MLPREQDWHHMEPRSNDGQLSAQWCPTPQIYWVGHNHQRWSCLAGQELGNTELHTLRLQESRGPDLDTAGATPRIRAVEAVLGGAATEGGKVEEGGEENIQMS